MFSLPLIHDIKAFFHVLFHYLMQFLHKGLFNILYMMKMICLYWYIFYKICWRQAMVCQFVIVGNVLDFILDLEFMEFVGFFFSWQLYWKHTQNGLYVCYFMCVCVWKGHYYIQKYTCLYQINLCYLILFLFHVFTGNHAYCILIWFCVIWITWSFIILFLLLSRDNVEMRHASLANLPWIRW